MLEAQDRLDFERRRLWIRLAFLLAPVLLIVSFGAPAALTAFLITAGALGSLAVIWSLLRQYPETLLRLQLWLRLLDTALISLVLADVHRFLGEASYDAVYILTVTAAAAMHSPTNISMAGVSGAAVEKLWRRHGEFVQIEG